MKYVARLKTSEWINDRSLFDYVTDSLDNEVSEDSERDIKYTMELVEIDEDDDTEEGKVIASTSVRLSELTTED